MYRSHYQQQMCTLGLVGFCPKDTMPHKIYKDKIINVLFIFICLLLLPQRYILFNNNAKKTIFIPSKKILYSIKLL